MISEEVEFKVAGKFEAKDIYKTALDTRNFEISLFWQRSNYFLVLNTALGVGYFNVKWPDSLLLALFGSLASLLWFRVNLGSKFWQSRWEQRLAIVERTFEPDIKFFAANKETTIADVKNNLEDSKHADEFRLWLDKLTLEKTSVIFSMTLLSLIFMLGWLVFALLFINSPLLQG